MLWLACHLPRLPLEALLGAQAAAVAATGLAVVQSHGSRYWIVASTDEALTPGMDRGLARVRRPAIADLPRQPLRELQALEALACAAYAFGDRICFEHVEPTRDFELPRFTLWIEIGASLRLFGGLTPLLTHIETEIAALGHRALFGVAPTLEAAAAIARAGAPPVRDAEDLALALAGLPLFALALAPDVVDQLHGFGLRDTAGLLALPREGLGRRFDKSLAVYLDRLLGVAADPRRAWRPPARFARRIDFLDEIENREGLMFPLRRLAVELVRYLAARDTGVPQFRVEIAHAAHDGRALPSTQIEFILTQPTRDESALLRVLRERLNTVTMPSAARALNLIAECFAHPGARQNDLFDRRAQTDEEAAAVLDRLRARLGNEAVWRPTLADDHRPERAWAATPESAEKNATPVPLPKMPRPLWLLREAKRLHRPPPIQGALERIESGWWDRQDIRRDYFSSDLDRGARGWIHSDLRDGHIHLQGLWG